MQTIDLISLADGLTNTWKSIVAGRPAGVNLKVLRMDGNAYAEETHAFDEALLVLNGCMRLEIGGVVTEVQAGNVFIVPANTAHGVAAGSHGTLVIIDP
jgi:quercetin dioxygenase-like cupin family protein